MMLFLDRLITLPLLLLRPPVKISFSLPMLLKFLALTSMGRFVLGVMRSTPRIVLLRHTGRTRREAR
ncbi:hypothetical protein ANAPH2_00394 [Anaplasma phagocytophilum]|nr:hypothetical protein ANAPH2_00394 [Anaplasma phagocytophilum]